MGEFTGQFIYTIPSTSVKLSEFNIESDVEDAKFDTLPLFKVNSARSFVLTEDSVFDLAHFPLSCSLHSGTSILLQSFLYHDEIHVRLIRLILIFDMLLALKLL